MSNKKENDTEKLNKLLMLLDSDKRTLKKISALMFHAEDLSLEQLIVWDEKLIDKKNVYMYVISAVNEIDENKYTKDVLSAIGDNLLKIKALRIKIGRVIKKYQK